MKIIISYMLLAYSSVALCDISYLSSLKKYGCIDPSDIGKLFKSELLSSDEKAFIIENFPRKVLEQGDRGIQHKIDSRIRSEQTEGEREVTKTVVLRKCEASVEVEAKEFNPKDFVTFAPSSITPDCLDSRKEVEPDCKTWKNSVLKFINSASDENPDFPLDITFEGHTNSISDKALSGMMGTPKHCNKGGIFRELKLCNQRIKQPGCRSAFNRGKEPSPSCAREMSLFKKKYLQRLSQRRALEMRKKFEELFKDSPDLKIVSSEKRDERIRELKEYIDTTFKESEELGLLQSRLDQLGGEESSIEALLEECYEISIRGVFNKDSCSEPSKQKLSGLNLTKIITIKTNKIRASFRSSSKRRLVHLKRSQGFGDSSRRIKTQHDDQTDRQNQRVEVRANRDRLSAQAKIDVSGNVTLIPGESLSCKVGTVNENRINKKNQLKIDSIMKKVIRESAGLYGFHNDASEKLSEKRLRSSKVDGDDKREDCEDFKNGDIGEGDRKKIETQLVSDIINYQFFGSTNSSCDGSAGGGGEDFSIDQNFNPSHLSFGMNIDRGKRSFECYPKKGVSLVADYKKLSFFNIKNPGTYKYLEGNHDDLTCKCKKGSRTPKKVCSAKDAIEMGKVFFKTPMGKKIIEMEKRLEAGDDELEPETRRASGRGLSALEGVARQLEGCARKPRENTGEVSQTRRGQDDPGGTTVNSSSPSTPTDSSSVSQ